MRHLRAIWGLFCEILRKKVWFLRNLRAFCELKKVCRKDENLGIFSKRAMRK
jgi:hypothetical protein